MHIIQSFQKLQRKNLYQRKPSDYLHFIVFRQFEYISKIVCSKKYGTPEKTNRNEFIRRAESNY